MLAAYTSFGRFYRDLASGRDGGRRYYRRALARMPIIYYACHRHVLNAILAVTAVIAKSRRACAPPPYLLLLPDYYRRRRHSTQRYLAWSHRADSRRQKS